MKKIVSILLVVAVVLFAFNAFATGSCTEKTVTNDTVLNSIQRTVVVLTCTGDGSIASYTLAPSTYNVQGWYLYDVTTIPGTSAPTDGYGITLIVHSEDIAGGLLANRSSTLTQTVAIAPPTIGYNIMNDSITITFSGETASPSTFTLTLRFTAN